MYKTPAKSRRVEIPNLPTMDDPSFKQVKEPVIVDKATECFVTPSDVAIRMVDYLKPDPDSVVLEPSAGTGALVDALTDSGHSPLNIFRIERHYKLWESLQNDSSRVLPSSQACFLEWSKQRPGAYGYVLMNPPFKHIKKHMSAALNVLAENGLLVALVPITYQHDDAELMEILPNDTFAGIKVNTKVIRIER